MSKGCSVPGCKNEKSTQGKNVSYYNIPTDIETKIKWMLMIFGKVDFKHQDIRICSAHFKKEDFEENVDMRDLNLSITKVLKEKAVPSLNLSPKSPAPVKTTVAPNVGNAVVSPVGIIIYQYNIQDSNIQNSTIQNSIQTDNSIGKVKSVKISNQIKIKRKIEDRLKDKINYLKADLRAEKHKCSLLQRKMEELRNKVGELQTSTKEAIVLNHEANLAKLCRDESSTPELKELLKATDIKIKLR